MPAKKRSTARPARTPRTSSSPSTPVASSSRRGNASRGNASGPPSARKSPSEKKRALEVEKEFGKDVRRATERSGRKPATWRASERPESREAVRGTIGAAAVQRATTRTWVEWRETLDAEGMQERPDREVVHHLITTHALTPWWAQMVCVGYQQSRRAPTPRAPQATGGLEVAVTRTLDASASDIFRAFNDPSRRQWSGVGDYVVRTAVAPRSLRLGLPDGSEVSVAIDRKGNRRCAVSVRHTLLADAVAADHAKRLWRDALMRLAGLLSE